MFVGLEVDGGSVANVGETIGARDGLEVTSLLVGIPDGVVVGLISVGISVAGPGPGSDEIAGALVGSKLEVSIVGLEVGSSDVDDAGSLVGELSLEPEDSDLLSDGGRLAFVLDVDEEDAFACFDDLLLFADLVDAEPFDFFIRFRRRFFRCRISFLRLLCRSFSSFALSMFRGKRFGMLLLALLSVLLPLLLRLLFSSRALILSKIFSNLLPVRLRPASVLDLSSACESILLNFLMSHSELLTFFSIFCRKSSILLRSDLNPRPALLLLLLLLLLLDIPDGSEFAVDLGFLLVLEGSLPLLGSLAPFRFPRLPCRDSFACFDRLPLWLVDVDDMACIDFDAFIRRGKYDNNSRASSSSFRRISTFCASDLRTWYVLFCAVASQMKCDATKRTGTIIQCGRFLFLLLVNIGGMHSIVASIYVDVYPLIS